MDNIKRSCKAYIAPPVGKNVVCDAPAEEQEPSCNIIYQIPNLKTIHLHLSILLIIKNKIASIVVQVLISPQHKVFIKYFNIHLTVCSKFFLQKASDYGGTRKEFFAHILREI